MTHEELDALWNKSVNISITAGDGLARYRYAEYVAAAEREAICELADNLLRTSDALPLIDAIRARGNADAAERWPKSI
jgi:hypothetical protein